MQTDPRIKKFADAKYREFKTQFDQRLDDAIKAAEDSQNPERFIQREIQSEYINEFFQFLLLLLTICS